MRREGQRVTFTSSATSGLSFFKVGAVCVYPDRVSDCKHFIGDSAMPIAAVATGFPAGQIKHEHKLEEIRQAVADGASEIDIVIPRKLALAGEWDQLLRELQDFRKACGHAHMKTILATGELGELTRIYKASMVCMEAGADFIKTSTGKEKENANLEVSLVMCRAIRDHYQRSGIRVGFKPAGGIRTAKQALQYLVLIKETLGDEWLDPSLFRLGASTLLTDIERQLFHCAFGCYPSAYEMPMP